MTSISGLPSRSASKDRITLLPTPVNAALVTGFKALGIGGKAQAKGIRDREKVLRRPPKFRQQAEALFAPTCGYRVV